MFDAKKTVVVSVIAVLYVFQQIEIRAQPTIDFTSEDDSCSQLEEELDFQVGENMQLRSALKSERQKMQTLGKKFTEKVDENQRLKLENKRLRLKIQPVTATLIGSFDPKRSHSGITQVEDKIYVINHLDPIILNVYEDMISFRFMTNITLSGARSPYEIVYSKESKCVYFTDHGGRCIWVMTTTGKHRLTKLVNNVTWPYSLSLSNEGHLLVLRSDEPFSQLEIYSLNATLIRRLQLQQDIKSPRHVVQTSDGNFILLHCLNIKWFGPWVISQLTNDGKLIRRFIPRNQSKKLNEPYQLSLDSDNDRLFVADYNNNRVILFDSSDLTWSQVLLSQAKNGIRKPCELFYDASKKYLFVVQCGISVTVYEIN